MSLSTLIDHLPAILADFPGISLVYLFGSQVTGQVGPMSDYDLAIVDESGTDDLTIQAQFQYALAKLLNTDRVDVVLLNRIPIELAFHIIADGKLLYQRDVATRVEVEADILGKHGDYLPVIEFFRQQTPQGDAHGKRVQRYREALERTRRTLGPAPTAKRSPRDRNSS